jgi:hypothetical protein
VGRPSTPTRSAVSASGSLATGQVPSYSRQNVRTASVSDSQDTESMWRSGNSDRIVPSVAMVSASAPLPPTLPRQPAVEPAAASAPRTVRRLRSMPVRTAEEPKHLSWL